MQHQIDLPIGDERSALWHREMAEAHFNNFLKACETGCPFLAGIFVRLTYRHALKAKEMSA